MNEQRIDMFVDSVNNMFCDQKWTDRNIDTIRNIIESVCNVWPLTLTSCGLNANQIAWSIIAPRVKELRDNPAS